MRESDFAMGVPTSEHQASLDGVVAVAVMVTAALVAPFAVATYPVLLSVVAPLLGFALVR